MFRIIALEELNWKIVDQNYKVWEPVSHNPHLYKEQPKEEQIENQNDNKSDESTCEKSGKTNEVKPWPYLDVKRPMKVPI